MLWSSSARLRRRSLMLAAVVCVAGISGLPQRSASAAPAHDFVRESIPRKWIEPLLGEDLPPLKFPEYYDNLDKAKALSSAGRYKLSLINLRQLKEPKPEQLVTIALVKARSLDALGRTDEALQVLSDPTDVQIKGTAAVKLIDVPRVQLFRAEMLAAAGRTGDALALLKEHLAAHPDSWGGHYLAGAISEQIGDTPAARDQYAWFVDPTRDYLARWAAGERLPEFEDAEQVAWFGRAVDRWATLAEKYRGNNALPNQILNIFVRTRQIDADYWRGHLAAAEYYLARDDRQHAGEEVVAALKANPLDAHALELMAEIGLQTFDFDKVDACIAGIRKANPASLRAELLESRNLLLQRRPKDAEEPIQRVIAKQPRSIEAMGLLAAVYALQLQEDKAKQILAQVDAIDVGGDNASAYLEVAQQLGAMRQYPRAAAMYDIAIERAPWWTAARNGLGLLYTQSGDEDKAYATLDKARELDPFNLETTNYMRLLDTMLGYKKVETPHFVIVYDAIKDPLIGEYFPDYMESIHAAVAGQFSHDPSHGGQPDRKTMIEVFPGHDAFSVRTTGSPWIGTVGASTGRVIALVSPGDKKMGTYNWAQVLRHEYTHTVTLGATDNRIQHWMTEGLAVVEERSPMRWEWVPMLYNAVKKHELFTMDNLTWGFVRPKRPIDRQLAYAQSAWICQYIEETYGRDAILKMLEMFRNAGRQEDVFPAVTGKSMSTFYEEFLAWCDKQVSGWGYDKETSEKYEKLKTKAEAAKTAHDYAAAASIWEEVAKLRPVDALPHQRLAGLYLQLGKTDQAVEHLDRLNKVELKDNRYAKAIARIYMKDSRWSEAARYGMLAVYIAPYDPAAHDLLLEIDQKAGDKNGAAREERVIPILAKWTADRRKADGFKPDEPPTEKKEP